KIGVVNGVAYVGITELAVPPNSHPYGITLGPDGDLWFTENGVSKIGRLNLANWALTEFPLPEINIEPGGITVGPDGNLWFTEDTTGKIGRITPAGVVDEFTIPTTTFAIEAVEITAGPDGNLWFTGGIGNIIGRITPAGVITTADEFPTPTASSGP